MPTLDESQLEFCQSPATNVRLLAPAGCGKTLALLHRCAQLAKQAQPRRTRFLLVTFTRAAKEVLEERLASERAFVDIRNAVEVTTLNAWGYRRIKNNAFRYNLLITNPQKYFAIENQLQPIWRRYDSIEGAIKSKKRRFGANPNRDLMKAIDDCKSLGFDHERHDTFKAFSSHWEILIDQGLESRLFELIDNLIRMGVLDSNKQSRPSVRVVWNRFIRFWIEATRHLIESATFTFEDQKYYAYLDERSHIEKGSYLSGAAGYDHVLVDEFQDINPLDMALVRAITERNRATLTIAGDDDQAIFEWRGGAPEYILNPDQHFGRTFETYTLSVNYRSPSNIVKHSQRLIAHNARRVNKVIRSYDNSSANQADIDIRQSSTLQSSMDFVIQLVDDAIKAGRSPSRIALISKLKGQIIPYQIHFASEGIPFCAAEDLQLKESDAFDRILRLVSIKESPSRNVINDILELCDLALYYPLSKRNQGDLRAHLTGKRPRSVKSATTFLQSQDGVPKIGTLSAKQWQQCAESIEEFMDAENVSASFDALGQGFRGLQNDFGKSRDDVFYSDPPFSHLAEYALRYGDDYDQFIQDVEYAMETLVHRPPFDDESGTPLPDHPLHLMTAPRAKGKEFDTVVLLDVNDGMWPYKNAETEAQLEAERRSFYVAFTRARKRVVMLTDPSQPPSPFIKELGLES